MGWKARFSQFSSYISNYHQASVDIIYRACFVSPLSGVNGLQERDSTLMGIFIWGTLKADNKLRAHTRAHKQR